MAENLAAKASVLRVAGDNGQVLHIVSTDVDYLGDTLSLCGMYVFRSLFPIDLHNIRGVCKQCSKIAEKQQNPKTR